MKAWQNFLKALGNYQQVFVIGPLLAQVLHLLWTDRFRRRRRVVAPSGFGHRQYPHGQRG